MNHLLGMMISPRNEWAKIRDRNDSALGHYLKFVLIIALAPPLAWYYGASEIGWEIGDRLVKLTSESAAQIMVLFYAAILASVAFLGFMVHWMSETYEANTSTVGKGIGVAAYTLVPMFLVGLTGVYPILWLDILLGCVAAGYTVYLLYIGVPIVMEIPPERGYLFASALVAVGLVMCAALLGATVILWEMGAMPVFTD
ncbi:MAG: Yip1 family protein [Pseudomonadales bacterium]